MKKVHLIFLFIIFLAFQSCKTVSNRVDKTISEEEKKLSKFLNKTTEELKIEFGEPDLIEITNKQNKNEKIILTMYPTNTNGPTVFLH